MRRLSAFLMIAALVAVLVPSAALAGKTPPSVTRILVENNQMDPVAEQCGVQVTVTIDGRAYQAQVSLYQGESMTFYGLETEFVNNRDHAASVFFYPLALGGNVFTWQVQLLDRKGNPLGTTVGAAETWDNTSACPAGAPLINYYPSAS